ncbi:MAG: M43 family zinc metalloprotease [Edaphocola sp.]
MLKTLLFNTTLVCCLLFAAAAPASAQICGADSYNQEQLRLHPELAAERAAFEKLWAVKQEELLARAANKMNIVGTDTTYEIPLVFHVFHTGSAVGTQFNPSATKIQYLVDYMNQTYAAQWHSYAQAGSGGTNVPIRFVLAKRTPTCDSTDGITRQNGTTLFGSTYTDYGVQKQTTNGITDATLKAAIQWDPERYYNIWVVNKVDGWSGYVSGSGVVGWAQFPGGTASTDGTVILEAFNDSAQTALPHELGHAFNLYHTFQGGCSTTAVCSTSGDYVCDTDPHDQPSTSTCPSDTNCQGTSLDAVNHNIMNYTSCTDRFTSGQSARMKAALLTYRGNLIQSNGGIYPGAEISYTTPTAVASTCTTPVAGNANNTADVGPRCVSFADLSSFSAGYTKDSFQVYIDRTQNTCGYAAVAPAHVQKGGSYTISVSTGYNPENVKVWIDYNNDGTFASGENVFTSTGVSGDSYRTHTGTITIPNTTSVTTNTYLRMRVAGDFYNYTPTACGGTNYYGQVEDFSVIIDQVLPVALVDFYAKANQAAKQIDVAWKVADELNVKGYYIEASRNLGKSFAELGYVPAKGKGSTYNFTDLHPNTDGTPNQYRLRMADTDGQISYSTIVTATIAPTSSAYKVFPNPATDNLTITVPTKGAYRFQLTNSMGQIVSKSNSRTLAANGSHSIDLRKEAAGIYYLQIVDENGQPTNVKVVKQ